MGTLSGYGISVTVPDGWDGRIRVRPAEEPASGSSGIGTAATAREGGSGAMYPVLHVANFALPAELGDYGGGATEAMGSAHVLVNMAEFGPSSVGTALYPRVDSVPTLRIADFDPQRMQRTLPGQSGAQRFFTVTERAFGLYVVLGSHRRRVGLADVVNRVLRTVTVS